jgi:hypothetical protein
MADIDLATLTPRDQDPADSLVVMKEGAPDTMGLVNRMIGLLFAAVGTPATPGAGSLRLFARSVGGRILPATIGPSGLDSALQPHIGRNKVARWNAVGNSTSATTDGTSAATSGTTTVSAVSSASFWGMIRKLEYLVTTAATNAIAHVRGGAGQFSVGGGAANRGGFHSVFVWGPATGVATTTHRAFCGMGPAGAPTDVNPSTLLNMCGMGWDDTDANVQFMHNDGSGVATKIDLGASFPVPTVDRTNIYRLTMFAPPGTTQSVGYEVENLDTGAVATGTVTTNLPTTTTLMGWTIWMSVGATLSVIGIAVSSVYIETDY